jgi:exonuclease III
VYLIDDANQVKMLLGGVHFWAKNDEVKNIERNQDLIRHVYHYLDREAYPHKDKCALMGDFNMNPYEPLLYKNHEPELPNTYSSELLILSNQEIIKKHYPDWFYNPCWNLLGDQFSKINYTYSAKIAKQRKYEKIFNVFDGVLLRKELFEVFQLPTLKIEDTGDISDHFPVIFEMEFNMTNL